MSPFEPLQPDIRQQQRDILMCSTAAVGDGSVAADTRTIALIASKKNFDPDKEHKLIEKARHTVCRCRHFTGTDPCLYRSCRHFPEVHYRQQQQEVMNETKFVDELYDVLAQKLEAERIQDEEDQLLYMQMCDDNQKQQQEQNTDNNPEYLRRRRKAEAAELMAKKSRKQYGRLIKQYAISLIKAEEEEVKA